MHERGRACETHSNDNASLYNHTIIINMLLLFFLNKTEIILHY